MPGRCFHWEAWVHILVLDLCAWDLPGQKGHGQRGTFKSKSFTVLDSPFQLGSGESQVSSGEEQVMAWGQGGGQGSGRSWGCVWTPWECPLPTPALRAAQWGCGDLAGHSGEHSFAQGLVVT